MSTIEGIAVSMDLMPEAVKETAPADGIILS